jgi:hypothetical protein
VKFFLNMKEERTAFDAVRQTVVHESSRLYSVDFRSMKQQLEENYTSRICDAMVGTTKRQTATVSLHRLHGKKMLISKCFYEFAFLLPSGIRPCGLCSPRISPFLNLNLKHSW